jgi:hypothetical protein
MAIFRQPPFQFGHSPLQMLNLVSQGGIIRHIPQQLPDLLTQHGIFRFQLGDPFFYTHGPILAALAIPYLCNYFFGGINCQKDCLLPYSLESDICLS